MSPTMTTSRPHRKSLPSSALPLALGVALLGPLLLLLALRGLGGRGSGAGTASDGSSAAPDGDPAATERAGGAHRPWPVVQGDGYPLVISHPDGRNLRIEAPPRRIVPANAAAVDFVLQLVARERIAALPEAALGFSRLRGAEAPPESLPRFARYRGEDVIATRPDLVITHDWQEPETSALLERNGIPVLALPLPESWGEVLATLDLLGATLGVPERARGLAQGLDARARALRARAPGRGETALSYANLGTGGWAAGAGTTADVLFELSGLVNAAAARGLEGHRSIDAETMLAIDPRWIVVGGELDPEGAGGRSATRSFLETDPTLGALRAVREGGIIELPRELFTTSSTELLAGAELLAERLESARELSADGARGAPPGGG